MTGPTREAAAELVRFVNAVQPDDSAMLDLFVALVEQLQLDPEEIPTFGDECGLEINIFRVPLAALVAHNDAA
jgi:hypothetical protein